MHKPNILYVAVGNPYSPQNGMDRVIRCHLDEIETSNEIKVRAVVVRRANDPHGGAAPPWVHEFEAEDTSGLGSLNRIRLTGHFLVSGKPVNGYIFYSKDASAFITDLISHEHLDAIVIDHFFSLCNLNISLLLKMNKRLPIIYIAHDFSYKLTRDIARLKVQRLVKVAGHLIAYQARMLELRLVKASAKLICISTRDETLFRKHVESVDCVTLLPLIKGCAAEAADSDEGQASDELLFVGSTSFVPNKAAIEWIVNSFSPALKRIDSKLQIRLIGSGTECYSNANIGNVVSSGYVDDSSLDNHLRTCVGVLSPIIHGSGLKIKILEAIAAGTVVFATEQSLFGMEVFGIPPMISLDDADATARRIDVFANSPLMRKAFRKTIRDCYTKIASSHQGGLLQPIIDLVSKGEGQ
jgi:glycosyltransferase involved in cell wall biosynthesis